MTSRLLAISLSLVLTALLPLGAHAANAPAGTDALLKLHQLRLAAQKVWATSTCTTAWTAINAMPA